MNNNQFEQLIRQMQNRVKSYPANPDAWRDSVQAKDALEKCKITPENAAIYNRLSAALQKVIVAAELHGG